MASFVIRPSENGGYYFVLKAPNGKVVLTSELYVAMASCEEGIYSVAENSQSDRNYERLRSSDGKLYFNLKAGNGEVIGTSELYESEGGRENGINSVKENAVRATIVVS